MRVLIDYQECEGVMKREFVRWMSIVMAIALLTVLAIAIPSPVSAQPPTLEGRVFEDLNLNGIDDGEPGIPDIPVSNGIAVTVTDGLGAYSLPMEGYFVFITTPNDYEPTTPWYRSTDGTELDFGLTPSPGKAIDDFVFVQISEIQMDAVAEHAALFQQDVAEINGIDPAFVVATGDLLNVADEATIAVATQWFDIFTNVASGFNMPLYTTVGNHDNVGIHNPDVDPTEPGYDKEMYRDYLGPTYYSFDWGSYHCVVLDPNQFEDGQQFYGIPTQQLQWLQEDLNNAQGKPLLVFYHEPTPSWVNRTEAWDVLTQHGEMTAFIGQLHLNTLFMDSQSQGIPEQVTSALSGEWWFGPAPGGDPRGYRINSIDADGISSFFKEFGADRQINITSPDVIVSGQATLTAQVYTEHGDITGVSYRVDGGGPIPMSIEAGELWDTATAVWDTTSVGQGYHTITIEATDGIGTFSTEKVFNVTEEERVPLGDLLTHYDVYRGEYTNVMGDVSFAMSFGPGTTASLTVIIIEDETGGILLLARDCINPPIPAAAEGDTVYARAIPIQYSVAYLETQPQFEQFLLYGEDFLPPSSFVYDGGSDPIALRVMTPVSAADIRVEPAPTPTPSPAPDGEGCFIATAAYGSYLDSHVETLRNFRDSYMLTNPVGSAMVSAYYKLSPPIAEFIDGNPALKPIVRAGLLPAVAMSTVAVNTTAAEKIAIVGSLALVSVALAVWLSRRRGKGVIS